MKKFLILVVMLFAVVLFATPPETIPTIVTVDSWGYSSGQTTIVYKVVGGTKPALSHWGMSWCVGSQNIVSVSYWDGDSWEPESYEIQSTGNPGNPECYTTYPAIKFNGSYADGQERKIRLVLEGYFPLAIGSAYTKGGNGGVCIALQIPQCGQVPPNPAIDIEKLVQDEDADTPTGPTVTVGATVTFKFIVTNTGDVPLANIVVTDNVYGTITMPKNSLAVGESMTGTTTTTAVAGQHTNMATVTGKYETQTVTDQDPGNYWGQTMRMPLQIEVSCIDSLVFAQKYRVHFTIINLNPTAVEIPVGLFNAIDPEKYNSQPTLFGPGVTEYELLVDNADVIFWQLDGNVAMGSRKSSPWCQYTGEDDVYIAGVGLFYDSNKNGQYDTGETFISPAPDDDGVMGEVYLLDKAGNVVASRPLRAGLTFRAERWVNFWFRQMWGEFYICVKPRILPAGYRIYPNYWHVVTPEFPKPFYSMKNDFGLVPDTFVGPLDGPYLPILVEYLPASAALAYQAQGGKGKLKAEGVVGVTQALPAEFQLNQNYPNPFNAETTIEYALPQESLVRLAVYDLMGRQVATLANGQQQPGMHRVVWDATGMPSGQYICELIAGEFKSVKRLILLK